MFSSISASGQIRLSRLAPSERPCASEVPQQADNVFARLHLVSLVPLSDIRGCDFLAYRLSRARLKTL
jgi:hypothetical protein